MLATDRTGIKRIEFLLTPPQFTFAPIDWTDTTFDASFSIPLSGYKHSSFSYSVSVIDVLDHRTDTPGVTVTVR